MSLALVGGLAGWSRCWTIRPTTGGLLTFVVFSSLKLLGQFENTGPPPAEKEKISSLPTVVISQEQAG